MEYTHTPVKILPLLDDRTYYMVKEGLGFLYSKTLEEHRKYLPTRYENAYKPFALYDKNPTDPVAKEFIKGSGLYFPKEDFSTYVSLVGGNLMDIAFVLENFHNKQLVLNETEPDLYAILLSLRDYPCETIRLYEKLVVSACSVSSNREANAHYKKVKLNYYENIGNRPAYVNSSFLLFLLHTGGFYANFFGKEGVSFYKQRISTLWQWHKVLSSPLVSLYHTDDYSSIPLPTHGRNLVVANTPEYDIGKSRCVWNPKRVKLFADYFNHIDDTTDSFLLVSSTTNPTFRAQFNKKLGWNTYLVSGSKPMSELYYVENRHKRNTSPCLVSNYELDIPNNELTQKDSFHTEEFLALYEEYCQGLL